MTQATFASALQRAAVVVCDLIQGEVLAVADACVTLADAAAPLSSEAAEVAAQEAVDEGIVLVPQRGVDHVVLLSQTCDLQVTDERDFHCLVAPVVVVSEQVAREALRGRRPRIAALPWMGSSSVVDLSRVTTIERSLLVNAASLGRPRTPRESLSFAEGVGRYLTRPALPDHVNDVLRPLAKRMLEQADKESPEGRCIRLLDEIRVEGDPDIDATEVALNVLMILEAEKLPTLPNTDVVDDARVDHLIASGRAAAAQAVENASNSVGKREAWTALAECWMKPSVDLVDQIAGIGSVTVEVLNDEELTYGRSKNAHLLDYRFLSTRAA